MATRSTHFESRVSPACNKHSKHVLEQKHVTIQQRLVEVPEVVIYWRRMFSLISLLHSNTFLQQQKQQQQQ
jgi:hypothetical protein